MRRPLGSVCLVLGATLVFLVPFLLLYSVPRLEKAPTDTDQVIYSNGFADFFSPKALQLVGPTPVQNVEVLKGDPSASTKAVAVVDYESHLVRLDTGASIDFDKEVYAFGRNTGVAANCCGEIPKMEGVTLKFPFGTQQKTYQLWDPSANRAWPAAYVRTDDVDGVRAYVFETSAPATQIGTIQLPNSLIGIATPGQTSEQRMYQADITIWVEPDTGQVLKGEKHVMQWAASGGTKLLTLADVHVTYSDATVAKFASDAKKNVKQLHLVKVSIPLIGGILGVVLVAFGLLLLWRRHRTATRRTPEPGAA